MNKIVYDKNTGLIKATCTPQQNVEWIMSRYENSQWISIPGPLPTWIEVCGLWVNPQTKQLEPKQW